MKKLIKGIVAIVALTAIAWSVKNTLSKSENRAELVANSQGGI